MPGYTVLYWLMATGSRSVTPPFLRGLGNNFTSLFLPVRLYTLLARQFEQRLFD